MSEISALRHYDDRRQSGGTGDACNHSPVYSVIGEVALLYRVLSSLVGYKKSVEFFVSQLPFATDARINILDAGCGTGLYTLAILQKYKNSSVSAFDANEKLVESLNNNTVGQYARRLRLFTADIQSPLPELRDDKFDVIITAGVLEHVPATRTVKNLSRFLKEAGYFFNSPVRDTAFGKAVCKVYGCKPYAREANIQSFTTNGFSLEKIVGLSPYTPASFKEGHLFKKTKP